MLAEIAVGTGGGLVGLLILILLILAVVWLIRHF